MLTQQKQGQVNQEIHPKDQMFNGDIKRYLDVGADALRRIKTIISTYQCEPRRILDFGCGCGRVVRHLRFAFPDAVLVASDVMPHAVEFCAENFKAIPHHSSVDLNNVQFDETFDLIWSGSLMTHLNEDKAIRMIHLLARSLKPNGFAILTTHGRFVEGLYESGDWPYMISSERFESIVSDFRSGIYGYTDYEHMKGYGISMTSIGWLYGQISKFDDIRVVSFIERGWDEHQDVFAIVKKPIA